MADDPRKPYQYRDSIEKVEDKTGKCGAFPDVVIWLYWCGED